MNDSRPFLMLSAAMLIVAVLCLVAIDGGWFISIPILAALTSVAAGQRR